MMVYVAFGALSVAAALAALDWFYDAASIPARLYGRASRPRSSGSSRHNGLAVAAKWLHRPRPRRVDPARSFFAYFRF
jgi:hypothetical protein